MTFNKCVQQFLARNLYVMGIIIIMEPNIDDLSFIRLNTRQFSRTERIQIPCSHGMNISP
jgi:hypothetical protein